MAVVIYWGDEEQLVDPAYLQSHLDQGWSLTKGGSDGIWNDEKRDEEEITHDEKIKQENADGNGDEEEIPHEGPKEKNDVIQITALDLEDMDIKDIRPIAEKYGIEEHATARKKTLIEKLQKLRF